MAVANAAVNKLINRFLIFLSKSIDLVRVCRIVLNPVQKIYFKFRGAGASDTGEENVPDRGCLPPMN